MKCNTNGSNGIVPQCGDSAGGMGAVAIIVAGIIITIRKIPAPHVVHIAVAVIVNAVIRNFSGVGP